MVDAPGMPLMGEVCKQWVFDLVAAFFGSYDHESGRRLIREYFLCISKKNGKSTIAAGVMLTALILNWRYSAEFLIISPTVEIANNSFYPARDMVKYDEELSDLMHVENYTRKITHRGNGGMLKVIAAEQDSVGGKKGSIVMIDELHLFGKRSNAEGMLREATGGLASRPEGGVIYLTTQSDEPPAGVFKSKLMYARKVRDGEMEDKRFLPVIYEFPQSILDDEGHKKEENFYITNPNLGASVDEEYLALEMAKADASGEESMLGFMAKHFNVEVGLALKSDRWAGADYWQRRGVVSGITLDDLIKRSEVVTVGIDGGGLDDLLGLSVIGREEITGQWLVWCKAWAHPSVMQRRKSEAPRFRDFAAEGDLVIVAEMGEDVYGVADIVKQCDDSGKLDMIGVDPIGLGGILDALDDVGVSSEKIIGISQGYKMSGVIKTVERRLADSKMSHGGSNMMAWCVGNAKVKPVGNAITITKQSAGFAKIDPLMALFNAAHLMALNPGCSGSLNDFLSSPIRA